MAQLRTSLLVSAILLCSSPAVGGLYEDIYRGLGHLATPSGHPVTGAAGGGLSNGSRYGRLRIVPNEFGQGHRLELDRVFGADVTGRPEVFDIGNLELELSGSTSATIQYTGRGIQTVNADIFSNNLSYSLRDKTGAQDVELRGALNVSNQFEINRLGFYELNLDISNTDASLNAEGVIVKGEQDTDFDVGPISIRGNIFVDAAAAAMNALGADASTLENLFPASPIDRINDEIAAYINKYMVLDEAFAAELFDPTLAADPAALDQLPAYDSPISGVPESSTLLLIGSLALIGLRRRK